MKRRWLVVAAFPLVVAGLTIRSSSSAFDHADAPQTVIDNQADIADVYSFMRPEPDGSGGFLPSRHLILVMTFAPGAKVGDTFSTKVDYVFRVRQATNGLTFALGAVPNFKVTCNFTAGPPQKVSCDANGTFAVSNVEAADAGDPSAPLRVWAGLRSDPAFADVGAFRNTISTGQNKFTTPGTNTFAGKNVMAIVVDLDVNVVALGSDAGTLPVFAVGGETKRNAI